MSGEQANGNNPESGIEDFAFFDEATYTPVIRRSASETGVADGITRVPAIIVSGAVVAVNGAYRYAADWRTIPNTGEAAVPVRPDPDIIKQEINNGDLL
jgi:hypothetical protein